MKRTESPEEAKRRCPECNSKWTPILTFTHIGKRRIDYRECQHCGKRFYVTESEEEARRIG